mmetsp:Transcript_14068/g.30483  ORF Transcript_14068/g.30483 Transcript_14068/m.30483 type:complete len:252 (-) Transcript_14068:104-859(-)
MMERQNRPRPRTRFSLNTSVSTALMFLMLTLLMMPLMLFLRASHVRRWYSADARSFTSCIMRASLKGGMYTPPVRPALAGFLITAAAAAGAVAAACSAAPAAAPLPAAAPTSLPASASPAPPASASCFRRLFSESSWSGPSLRAIRSLSLPLSLSLPRSLSRASSLSRSLSLSLSLSRSRFDLSGERCLFLSSSLRSSLRLPAGDLDLDLDLDRERRLLLRRRSGDLEGIYVGASMAHYLAASTLRCPLSA